jgi:hypothetical protein
MSSIGSVPAPNLGMRDLPQTPSAPEDHYFHDSSDCPHGARIERYVDPPSDEFPRRCNWCTEHDRPAPS